MYYAIDQAITQQAKTGVTLLLATPTRPCLSNDEEDHPSSFMTRNSPSSNSTGEPLLVSCGAQVVIKAVPKPVNAPRVHADDAVGEIAAMQLLQHLHHQQPHGKHHPGSHRIIKLLDAMQDEEYLYLVLPYLSGGDMFDRVEATKEKGLHDEEAAAYLKQIVEG